MRPITFTLLSFFIYSFALPSAQGNFGNYPCGWHSEPSGLQNIRIVSERLTIDLRGCDGSDVAPSTTDSFMKQPVGKVEAVYSLHNRGLEQEVHLVFAAGALIERDAIHVSINKKPVPVLQSKANNPNWAAIIRKSGINRQNGPYWYPPYEATNFSVRLKIPAGFSTLRADFRTLVGNDRSTLPTCHWEFIYLLAPARDWGAFDKLEAKVLIPPGWKAESNLDLQRNGDILSGTFDRIPDDSLNLAIRMPPEPILEHIEEVRRLTWLVVAASVPMIFFATWIFGRKIRSRKGMILLLLGSALLWGVTAWLSACFLLVYPAVMSWIPLVQRGSSGSTFGDGGIEWFLTWAISFVAAACGAVATYFWLWRARSIGGGAVDSPNAR